MDLLIIVVLILIVVCIFKEIGKIPVMLGIVEIFLRLINYFGDHLGNESIQTFINNYFPDSLYSLVGKYTEGVTYDVLSWGLFAIFVLFLIYLLKKFFSRR
jgi:hypothetical protein